MNRTAVNTRDQARLRWVCLYSTYDLVYKIGLANCISRELLTHNDKESLRTVVF